MTNDAFNSLLNECVRHDLSNAIFSIQGMMEIIDEEIADEKRKKSFGISSPGPLML